MARAFRTGTAGSAAAGLLLAALGGCGKPAADTDSLDRALVGNAAAASAADSDPALTAALADQIMVDPALASQANDHSVRRVEGPAQAPIPADIPDPADGGAVPALEGLLRTPPPRPVPQNGEMTLTELARMQAAKRGGAATPPTCDEGFQYSLGWADRLPAAIPIYPQAQVSEAAGSDQPGCGIRVVSFTSRAALQTVLDFYYTRTLKAGFTPEHQASGAEHILAGSSAAGAFYLTVRPGRDGGVEADLVSRTAG